MLLQGKECHNLFSIKESINGSWGYVLVDKHVYGARTGDLAMLMPFFYRERCFSACIGRNIATYTSKSNLIPISKKSFIEYTSYEYDKACIELLYEDEIILDIDLVNAIIPLLKEKYEFCFAQQTTTIESIQNNIKLGINKHGNNYYIKMSLFRGEDVLPPDVDIKDSLVLVMYDNDYFLFNLIFSNNERMLDTDGFVSSTDCKEYYLLLPPVYAKLVEIKSKGRVHKKIAHKVRDPSSSLTYVYKSSYSPGGWPTTSYKVSSDYFEDPENTHAVYIYEDLCGVTILEEPNNKKIRGDT